MAASRNARPSPGASTCRYFFHGDEPAAGDGRRVFQPAPGLLQPGSRGADRRPVQGTQGARGGLIQAVTPNPALVIEPGPGLLLSKDEGGLLRALFKRYGRLVVQSEFHSGYSGARTLLALPIHPDGRADAATIVKIGRRADVQCEFENYEAYVKDSLRRSQPASSTHRSACRATKVHGPPSSTPLSPSRATCPKACARRCWKTPTRACWSACSTLLGLTGGLQRKPYAFRLAQEYDQLLPPHSCSGR